jgi:Zn-finger nucleic acid-binding protein
MMKTGRMLSGCFLGFLVVFVFAGASCTGADTGTYTVSSQNIDLWVQTDGDVMIRYEIGMLVKSGNIPWVTVGLPTSNFEVRSSGGNAASVIPRNSGDWSGVYVTLDKTYYANEQFVFSFAVLQKEFIYKYNDQQASLLFTPCWWDNAVVEHMNVTIHLPPEIQSVTTTSQPTLFMNSSILWEWKDVPAGDKKSAGVLMPLSAFSHVGPGPGFSFDFLSGNSWILLLLAVVIGGVVLVFVLRGRFRSAYEDPQMNTSGFRKLIKHINLDCPNDGSKLDRRSFQGTTIDFCDTCGGGYFDKGEIESLLEAGVNEQEFNKKQVPSFRDYSSPVGTCPRCDGVMETVTRSSEHKDYRIFVCKECRGIWLNKGIYQAIKDKRVEQDAAQQEKLKLVGDKKTDQKKAYYAPTWWWFYPYIFYPHRYQEHLAPVPPPVPHSCACVSCACVSSCACACACAGGGAAGCAPKDTTAPQIMFQNKLGKR